MVRQSSSHGPGGRAHRVCFPSPGPQQLLPGSLCIKSVPQQLSTDTPQPGIISQVSGQGFSPLLIPHSMGTQTECEVSGNKSATRGVHGSPGKQGEPGEEQGGDE